MAWQKVVSVIHYVYGDVRIAWGALVAVPKKRT